MPDTPLNPDALEAGAQSMECQCSRHVIDCGEYYADCPRHVHYPKAVSAYLALAQPEVNSVEELDALPVGSVVRGVEYGLVGEKIRYSPYPPHWCTIGQEVQADERDLLPARVLYRPTKEATDGRE